MGAGGGALSINSEVTSIAAVPLASSALARNQTEEAVEAKVLTINMVTKHCAEGSKRGLESVPTGVQLTSSYDRSRRIDATGPIARTRNAPLSLSWPPDPIPITAHGPSELRAVADEEAENALSAHVRDSAVAL